ncbi:MULTISPECIES: hypothetical protein [unclassified Mesorhizobium]|uniref:hypothetical protein n=1 Tax=unclassified Mesorhizobium TaxID=325217 RepID=UPI000FCCB0DD|nr:MULTISPECIES: hypothetical protein [unclassified Mesorhizobium]TGP20196.1 hypothetical protein EN874_025765 [Mesorhizobium sp. M1D.F.Ca.ET.231.01.1.1]TGP27673.1 hypothetical protein EN877_25055 [Mesorhizobium sp. M1D.F.Ca.ET.234.01.1.1]TGS42023.1 hypothetical protein EN827_24140 [Mesorhizobium sp. M1D.F.Ca.ET.184.01.1.1]TGS59375.1 hypothetical protein EN826_024140 [Mesorhizobium sp. M1D.F.Ca.ET.183.01.1.1]
MSPLSVLNNTALPILQPQRPPATARSATDSLAGSGSSLVQAPAGISQSMFSVNSLNVTATKVRLMERAGKEFGLDQADYESVFSYGSAVKNAVEALKRQSPSAIAEIERQLGLDQLGISLDTLVNAIVDPTGGDRDPLDAAPEKHLGEIAGDEAAWIQPDEIGLYGG